jgi:hypothetical protein
MRTQLISLISLALTACAAVPQQAAEATAGSAGRDTTLIDVSRSGSVPLGTVQIDVDGTLPAQESPAAKLAGRVSVSTAEPVRYSMDYALTPGDVLAHATAGTGLTRIGTRSLGHTLDVQTPVVLGAPLALRLRSESGDDWTIAGRYHREQESAEVSWAPRGTALKLQWLGEPQAIDPTLALGCDIVGSVQLPAKPADSASTRMLDLSGNYCSVLTDDARFALLDAHRWRVARVWRSDTRESRLALSVIDPVWERGAASPDIAPSYQVKWQMRHDAGAWSAIAGASLRDRGTWSAGTPTDPLADGSDAGLAYATDATLTRRLGDALISTTWAHGANPLWFLPESGSTHRFDVSLDFSRWAQDFMPYVAPRLGLSFNRWETTSAGGIISSDQALMLQFSMTL